MTTTMTIIFLIFEKEQMLKKIQKIFKLLKIQIPILLMLVAMLPLKKNLINALICSPTIKNIKNTMFASQKVLFLKDLLVMVKHYSLKRLLVKLILLILLSLVQNFKKNMLVLELVELENSSTLQKKMFPVLSLLTKLMLLVKKDPMMEILLLAKEIAPLMNYWSLLMASKTPLESFLSVLQIGLTFLTLLY